ncbi:protein mono-ADP-ribosyltransferase PARP15-like isoform X2 [Pelobates fuscus]
MSERCELVIEEVLVRLKNGDITQENVDAVVNLTNSSLSHNFGISKAILAAGGPSLQDECKIKGKQPHGDVVVTGAGNLKCKNVIHVIGATRPQKITNAVMSVLQECDKNNLGTVAIPAIGTGVGQLHPQESFRSVLKGIKEYLSCSISLISEITIVTFLPNIYHEYVTLMNCEIAKFQNQNIGITINGSRVEFIRGDITEQDVDCILNLNHYHLNRSAGVSGAILSAAGKSVTDECACYGTLPASGIAITSGGRLKSRHIMHVIGPTRESAFASSLEKILKECETKSFQTVALPAIGTGSASIDPKSSVEAILNGIELCLQKMKFGQFEKIVIVAYTENVYNDFLQAFKARQSQEIKIKADNVKQLCESLRQPANWRPMDLNDLNVACVELNKDTAEYKKVETDFMKSQKKGKTTEITKIERIQNAKMWLRYALHKFTVDSRYPDQENERHLYHGTSKEATMNINLNGFNRSYNGKNATRYGKGTYFATRASYSSDDKYSPKDDQEEKRVYQVAVITGKYCYSDRTCIEPPPTPEDPKVRYDSTVDNVNNPKIFVIFYDDRAYPEYLITFKQSGGDY